MFRKLSYVISHARWSDHVVNFARANPLNLTTTTFGSSQGPVPIISGLFGESRPRQIGVMVGILHNSALREAVAFPGRTDLEVKFIDQIQLHVDTHRQFHTCSMGVGLEKGKFFCSNKAVRYTTPPGKIASKGKLVTANYVHC